MNYNWDWSIYWNAAPAGGTYFEMLLSGLAWTVFLAALSWVIALAVGTLVGAMRTVRTRWIRRIGTAYVELLRNVPLLVQMFLWYFVIPDILPGRINFVANIPPPWNVFLAAMLALGFYTASRVAEQVRSGIESLSTGQRNAAAALGLTTVQTYRYVLFPVAFRVVLPPLTSELLNLIKNTSVAFTIGLMELLGAARAMQEFTFHVFETFTMATVFYLILNLVVILFVSRVERLLAVPGFIGKPS